MTKTEKTALVDELKDKFSNSSFFYITDTAGLDAGSTSALRRLCFEKGVEMRVLKNTLVRKALEQLEESDKYEPLYDSLKGPSAIMFTETSNVPAKLIKEFRESAEKPILKAAYIDSDIFIGDEQVEMLSKLKSKEELIGEIIGLLQSPAKNVISGLQSGGSKLAGILQTLAEKEG